MLSRVLFVALAALAVGSSSLTRAQAPATVVDENGVWRWSESGREVALYGVNYTAPFAYAFRAHQRLGVSIEQAIDADVYHFARLGLDAYRVHVWDREISDADGNLIVNEHVRALDYLLAKLKERGIKMVLTPLQFGNAGYPEAGLPLPGFSSRYGKRGCLEDRTSWPLQERYLEQFARHVNPHTGLAYKDDPDVIAFEICNEPGHFEYAPTLEYINRMTQALRTAGARQPIFYNMSHGLPVFEAYLDANIQGGTFQWYPSNLLAGHEQRGNFLPYLDRYPIPFADHPKFKTKAKLFYEFDPADLGRSYTYPAMARTFRKVGAQFATQFAYDPLYLAPFNTEYQTHYMNLVYAPQKALSLMIAAEAFRRVPRLKDYGSYPNNTRFEGVRVSYAEDLAELITDEKYLYTNTTRTPAPAAEKLQQIAGFGTSPLVGYPGRGAYFLDRIAPGVWRLEVMPDAIWVHDPYAQPSPKKQVSRIVWAEWPMHLELPDLGHDFRIAGVNDGNAYRGAADDGTFTIQPGTYLLSRREATAPPNADAKVGPLRLREFVAPPASMDRTYVLHEPPVEVAADRPVKIVATVAAPSAVRRVELVVFPRLASEPEPASAPQRAMPGGGNTPGPGTVPYRESGLAIPMTARDGFDYTAEIPAEHAKPGTLRYCVVVHTADGAETFPAEFAGTPADWDFFGERWEVQCVPAGAPILLFDAATDAADVTSDDRDVRYPLVPSDRPGTSAMEVTARNLESREHDHSFRTFCAPRLAARASELRGMKTLVLYGRSAAERPETVQVALVTADGAAYGARVTVPPKFGAVSIPLSALTPVRTPNIPHGYPVFIPYWSEVPTNAPLALDRVEAVLVSIGPGISAEERRNEHGVRVERLWLE